MKGFSLFQISVLKTLYLNFKCFNIRQALKLPVVVFKKCKIKGLYRGCITYNGNHRRLFGIPYAGIFNKSFLYFAKNAKLCLGDGVRIANGFNITINSNSLIKFDDFVFINSNVMIACYKYISIGKRTRIGWNVQILDSNIHLIYDLNTKKIYKPFGKVDIGKNVWIGNHVSISKGCIPSYSIVAANSLVNKDFYYIESVGNLFAGVPATLKKTGIFRIFDFKTEAKYLDYFYKNDVDSFEVTSDEIITIQEKDN